MRQFKTIFKYEFKNYLTNKVFVGVTLALIILLGGITFIPRLIGSDDADSTVNIVKEAYYESVYESKKKLL